ncbi:hypothetical protein EGW08_009948 [Elysia chlorotica]|uniref:Amine oxidase domain-containing protein n=1 Tax=Elysia chlorotica TaxID=188477 RepID=A0A433TL08_ELYCH|nr:hypothetical protein EGW08_009948 [Elysia chlorotica]
MSAMEGSWSVWSALCLALALLSAGCSAKQEKNNKCSVEHDVAIVGAGISGAYSAFKLKEDGLNIGMYEYSDRIGGRFYTEHLPDVPDQNVELGGMRLINKLHVLLQGLIKDLNLTEKVLLYGSDATYPSRVFRRNVSMTSEQFSSGDIPYNLTSEEKANQADLLRYLFRKLTGDSLDNVTEESVFDLTVPDGRKLYMLSTPEALSLVASPEAHSYLLNGNHFNNPNTSATDMVYYYFGSHGRQKYTGDDVLTIEEGFNQIVISAVDQFLQASRSHSIEKNMKLEAITGKAGKYVLQFRRTVTVDDETIELHHRESTTTVCAKKVILALPKYALSQLDWKPLRSKEYEDLLEGTFVAHTSKVFMSYENPWWIDQARYPTRVLDASGLGEVYDWGQSNLTGHWTLLVSYTKQMSTDTEWALNNGLDEGQIEGSTGGLADMIAGPDTVLPRIPGSVVGANRVTAPLKDYLYERLALAFGIPRCAIPEPVSSIARFWVKYPFGGGWVFSRPGYTFQELIKGYRRPSKNDDVFVVGNDYSARDTTGWSEGALWTVEQMMGEYF